MEKSAKAQRQFRPAIVPNACRSYEHEDGCPYPESECSCRGCRNSYDPERYDGGCKLVTHERE